MRYGTLFYSTPTVYSHYKGGLPGTCCNKLQNVSLCIRLLVLVISDILVYQDELHNLKSDMYFIPKISLLVLVMNFGIELLLLLILVL